MHVRLSYEGRRYSLRKHLATSPLISVSGMCGVIVCAVHVPSDLKQAVEVADGNDEDVVLIIPTSLDGKGLLHTQIYAEHTGNEAQPEEMVYLLTAVIIRNKLEL